MTSGFHHGFSIAVLGCLASMGIGRAIFLKTKKIQVFVLDAQISRTQLINGVLFVICFSFWIMESLFHGLSLNDHTALTIPDKMLLQNDSLRTGGIPVSLCGLLIYATALYSFRDSWRIGIDRRNPGRLITTGIFRWSRNPIYVSLDLIVLGSFLLHGRLTFLILFTGIAMTLHIQILQEEKYLLETFGNAYIRYRAAVGRYFRL